MSNFLVAAPGLFTQAAAAPGDLEVNIVAPASDAVLGASEASPVVVTWTSSIPSDEQWICRVQLDSGPVVDAMAATGHMFDGVAEGYHTVKVWAYNLTGAWAYDSVNFIVDLANPALEITSPANNAKLNASSVNVTWSASDPSYISFFEVCLDGGAWNILPPSAANMEFDELAEGLHTFIVVAHDMAGKTTTKSVTFKIDTIPPFVDITSPANGTGFNQDGVTVSWVGAEDDSLTGYEVWVDEAYVITAAPSGRQYASNYADGYHTVTVVAVDEAGNTASDSVTFYVDTTELAIVAHGPTGGGEEIDAAITVQFSKEMDRTATSITVSGVSGTTAWDGPTATFVPSSPLSYGAAYTVTVTGQDLVGNPITLSWSFTTTNLGTISGIVRDDSGNPLSGAKVTLDGGESMTTDDTGAYSFQVSAGPHELRITKAGWDPRTYNVEVVAGDDFIVNDENMVRSDILGLLGIVAAVIAVGVVALLFYFSQRRRKDRGPPTRNAPRSWKGMSELQKRAMRSSSRRIDDDDDELDRL